MSANKNTNKIIRQGFEEYAKADTKDENMDVKFSEEHEVKMQKIFDSMRVTKSSEKTADREIVIRIKFGVLTKVAVALVIFFVATTALSTGIKAWKESKLESYGGTDEYSWLLSNNTSEIYEQKTTEEAIEYVKSIFPGLSGEISDVEISNFSKVHRVKFKHNGKSITIKMGNDMNLGINTKDKTINKVIVEDTEITYCSDGEIVSYRWNYNGIAVNLYGNIKLEEISDFVDFINYEKIETNF